MTLILPNGKAKWEKTLAEKKGYVKTQHGALEGGCQFPAYKLRKEHASEVLSEIAKKLWFVRQKMADIGWDDEQTQIVVGIQARNKWVEDSDGEWTEMGSPEWLDKQVKKAT